MTALQIESGPSRGRMVDLGPAGLTVGRQASNTLVLDDQDVSRNHARFEIRGGQILVTDLAAANGTYVNGQRISGMAALVPGDEIRIGATTLRLVADTAATQIAAAPAPRVPAPPAPGPAVSPPPYRPAPIAPLPHRSRIPLIIGGTVGACLLLCFCVAISLLLLGRSSGGPEAGAATQPPGTSVVAGGGTLFPTATFSGRASSAPGLGAGAPTATTAPIKSAAPASGGQTASGGLPLGVYACAITVVNSYEARPDLEIISATQYRTADGPSATGTYRYDPASRRIEWGAGGAYGGKSWFGVYDVVDLSGVSTPRIAIQKNTTGFPKDVQICFKK